MSIRASSPVLVGRAEQLSALGAARARAAGGAPAAVLVGGEAGIGKSRLLAEFATRASAAGSRVLAGGCMDLSSDGFPFAPFAAILRALVREVGAEGVAALMPGQATGEFARLLPEFGRLPVDPVGCHRRVARARPPPRTGSGCSTRSPPSPVALALSLWPCRSGPVAQGSWSAPLKTRAA